jgi:hypothetical protein
MIRINKFKMLGKNRYKICIGNKTSPKYIICWDFKYHGLISTKRQEKRKFKLYDKVEIILGFNKGAKGVITDNIRNRGQGASYIVKVGDMTTLYQEYELIKEVEE